VTINGTGGTGGAGGGGDGGRNAIAAGNGTAGTGSGGGGGGPILSGSPAGAGGSGTVIVRYTGSAGQVTASNATSTTVGGDTVWTFATGTGSFTSYASTTPVSLTVTGGNITYNGAIGGTSAFDDVSFTSTNSQALPSINATNIFAHAMAATADISLNPAAVLSASGAGNALTLVAGRNFINNSGAGALTMTGAGRWLVYSTNPANDTTGGLGNNFRRFSCSYASAGTCAFNATVNQTVTMPATTNGFLYSYTPTITVTPDAIASIVYGSATPTLTNYARVPFTAGDYLTAGDFATDTVTGSLDGSTTYAPGPVNGSVGSYNIDYASGELFSDLGYGFTYANNASAITVTQRPLTVSLTGTVSKQYNANANATLVAGNYSIANIYNSEAITISNTSGTYDDKNVGTGKNVTVNGLTLAGATAGNYSLTAPNVTDAVGTITQAPLTVSATGISKAYDGNTTASVTLSDDRFSGDVLTLSFTSANFASQNVGTGITVSVAGINVTNTDSGNYSFNTTATTTANITKAPLTATANTQSVTYGVVVPATTITYTGFALGEDETFLATAPTTASALGGVQSVGTYTGNYTVSGGVDSNYNFIYVAGNLIVTKKDLNVTADTITVTYGTATPAGTLTYSGFIIGEDATNLTTAPTVASGLSGVQNVGTYAGNYTPSGGVADNYNFLYFNGNLVVTKKDLNVTADNKTVNFGTVVPVGTFVYSGFITGDNAGMLDVAPTVSSALAGIQNAGSYAGNYTVSGGSDNNYNYIYVTGDYTVNPLGLNVTLNNQTVTYGTAVPATTITYTGFLIGQDETFLDTLPTIASVQSGIVAAGTYTGNYTASGAADINYTFNYIPGNLTVSPKPLNVTAGNRTVTYGTAVPTSSLTYTGFIPGEDATFLTTQPSITSGQSGIVGAGSYLGNYVASGGVSNNYSFNYTAGDLVVSKKTLVVSADTITTSYGTAVPAGTLTYAGFITGEDATFLNVAPVASSGLSGLQAVGTYVGNYTASGGVSANYNFSYNAGDLIVGKRTLNVTAQGQTITYGTVVPATTIAYSGFATGEDATFLTTAPSAASVLSGIQNAGSYANNFTASGGVSANYDFVYNTGTLTVNAAPVTISANNVNQVYGAGNALNGYSITGLLFGDTITNVTLTPNATLSTSNFWNAGSWQIQASAANGGTFNPANYAITYVQGALNVTPRALTVSAAATNKPFDGNANATVTLSDDRLAGDIFTIGYTSALFPDANVGNNRTVTVNGIALTGTDSGNYNVNSTATALADIIAAATPIVINSEALPNTVVMVSQNTSATVTMAPDDGIYATPTGAYLLDYLPEPVALPAAPSLGEPDEEKRLRRQRVSPFLG
jgi:hypothetical protein